MCYMIRLHKRIEAMLSIGNGIKCTFYENLKKIQMVYLPSLTSYSVMLWWGSNYYDIAAVIFKCFTILAYLDPSDDCDVAVENRLQTDPHPLNWFFLSYFAK